MSKKLSGAENRKRKNEMEEKVRKLPKISSFFKLSTSETKEDISDCDSQITICEIESAVVPTTSNPTNLTVEVNSELEIISNSSKAKEEGEDSNDKVEGQLFLASSDIANYSAPLNEEEKSSIMLLEPCRPEGPFPKDGKNRSFNSDFYYLETKTGQKLERFWLCYSPLMDGVYCEPCWLFADRNDPNFKDAWTTGKIKDWQGISKKIKEHEVTRIHLNSCLVYSMKKKTKRT